MYFKVYVIAIFGYGGPCTVISSNHMMLCLSKRKVASYSCCEPHGRCIFSLDYTFHAPPLAVYREIDYISLRQKFPHL